LYFIAWGFVVSRNF